MLIRVIATASILVLVSSMARAEFAVRAPATTIVEESRFVPDEFIMILTAEAVADMAERAVPNVRPSLGLPSIQRLLAQHGVESFRRQFPVVRAAPGGQAAAALSAYYKVRLAPGTNLEVALTDFAANPYVERLERIGVHPLTLEANDTYYDSPPPDFPHRAWHIKQIADHDIDGNLAWDLAVGDATVIVGILDTGVRYIHADLGGSDPPGPADNTSNGNIWINSDEIPGNGLDDDGNGFVDDVIGYDFVHTSGPDQCAKAQGEDCQDADNDPRDFNGHGTAVAGCVAAITNNGRGTVGVAGGFSGGSPADPANGARIMCLRVGWQANSGVGFVRMDFAAEAITYAVNKKLDGHNVVALNCSWGSSNSGGLDAAVNFALANDVMIIHAAGNGASDSPGYLGGKAGVMNVAATDSNDARAGFSDFGDWVDLAAPGDDIITSYHSYQDPDNDYVVLIGGTSFSAPIACGVAALLKSLDSSLAGPEIFDIMVATGDDIGDLNIGLRLNARAALDSVTALAQGCACDCHGDPACDGATNIFDVVAIADVAFRNGQSLPDPNPLCPFETTDVTCDGATNIFDAVRMADVAFRGADPQTAFCDPCP